MQGIQNAGERELLGLVRSLSAEKRSMALQIMHLVIAISPDPAADGVVVAERICLSALSQEDSNACGAVNAIQEAVGSDGHQGVFMRFA